MMQKITLRRFAILSLLVAIAFGINYCARSFPIISGYGAKVMCSGIFVAGRPEASLRKEELGFFPLNLGHFTVDYSDSSVTGSVLGLARQKAIFRAGLGATLVSEISEDSLRAQKFLMTGISFPPDSLPWPLGEKTNDSLPTGIDRQKLNEAIHAAFVEEDSSQPVRTRAVVVLYDGQLAAEAYAPGFSRQSRLQGWSMTKSVTSALIGIMCREFCINADSPATVPEWANPGDPRHRITLKDLLQQSSGLDFSEDYSRASDATIMLYETADMGRFTARHKLRQAPGTVFYYSSGNSNILSRLLRQQVGDSDYYAYPYAKLFSRLGMRSAIMEPDASGSFVGSSYMYATARDWARFGLLYANRGIWQGDTLLSPVWVDQTVQPAPACLKGEYGYQFWLNAGGKDGRRKYPHAPADLFCADGFESQYVFVIPSRKLVVVRLGLTQHHNFDADKFLQGILAAVK